MSIVAVFPSLKPKPDELFFAHANYYPPNIFTTPSIFTVYSEHLDDKPVFQKKVYIDPRNSIK